MSENSVMFLEVPVQGQRAKMFHNGQEASTSAVQTVEFKEGWYKVTTASGNCYVGQVQPQQQPVVSGATVYHQTPQQPQQAYQPQQTVTATPAPYQPLQHPVRKKTTVCGVCILIALVLIVASIGRALFRAVENSISAETSKQTATGNSSSPSAESADKSPVPIGSVGQLDGKGETFAWVCRTPEADSRLTKACVAKDWIGIQQMEASGEAVEVPDGTKVQVIDIKFGVDELKNVRILEGEHYGMAGWLEASYVRSLRSTKADH